MAGCASTEFSSSGETPRQPLCETSGAPLSALVLWGPQWRPNQKDVPDREAAAQRGVERFFAESGCFSTAVLLRPAPGELTDQHLLQLAHTHQARPDRVLVVTVRELGPVLRVFGPIAPVEGGTEVVLDIRAVDVKSGLSMARFQSHWRHGGPMVVKGVDSLASDMYAALKAALPPAAASR
jgi:hypothetical protein